MDANKNKNSTGANLAMLLVSMFIVALVLELVARQLMPAPLSWHYPQIRYQSDSNTIFSMRPGQKAYTADKPAMINESGLRGKIYDYEKADDVTRILFLGDSVVFGYGVAIKDVVTSRLEKLLGARGDKVEVINTGVPSFNTEQEVAFLENEGIRYKPDFVILGFYWNDISDKSSVKVSESGWLIERDSDESELGYMQKFWLSRKGYKLRNLLKRSRFMYALMQGYKTYLSGGAVHLNAGLRTEILEGKESEYLAERWRTIEQAMQKLKFLSGQNGFTPIVVAFPIPVALASDYPDNRFVETIHSIAVRTNMHFLDLEPAFREAYKGHESLFIPYDSDHPNAAGHAVAAKAIADFFVSENLINQQ